MTKQIIKVKEADFLTTEQREAISKAHNAYFYAAMSDSCIRTIQEERTAKQQLKQIFPNLIDFIADFDDCNDTLILQIGE